MTTIEGAMVAILKADSAVSAIVGDRIHPATDPQRVALPKLSFQRPGTNRSSDVGGYTNDGPTGYAVASIQIDCWSNSLLVAKQAIAAVRRVLNGYSGSVGGAVINAIQVVDERELPGEIATGQAKPVQRQMLQIKIQYQDI